MKSGKFKLLAVVSYNKFMGRVDLIDKIVKPHYVPGKSVKWYKKLSFHTLQVASFNTLALYRKKRSAKALCWLFER